MFVLIQWFESFEGCEDEDGMLHECSQCETIPGGEYVIEAVYGPFDTREAAEAAQPKERDNFNYEVREVKPKQV